MRVRARGHQPRASLGVLVEDQARVGAAEAEGVGHDPVHLALVALGQDVHALGLVHLVRVGARVRDRIRVRLKSESGQD